MSHPTGLATEQSRRVEEWRNHFPGFLSAGDSVNLWADEADPKALRIHIDTAHSKYSFDFKCTDVDGREVKVDFIDAEKDGQSVDEHNDIIQNLIEDYVRHIHECAQLLRDRTHR